MMLVLLLACVGVLVVTLYLQHRWQHRRVLELAASLPCPPALPLLGNALFFRGDVTTIIKNVTELAIRCNGLCCVWAGLKPLIVVSNPADVKIIFNSSSMLNKMEIHAYLAGFMREGILLGPAPVWKKYRRLINPMFAGPNLEQFLPLFHQVGENISATLAKTAGVHAVDPTDTIFDNVIEAALQTTLGDRTKLSNDEIKSKLKFLLAWSGKELVIRTLNPFYYYDWIFRILYWQKYKKTKHIVSSLISDFNKEFLDFSIWRKQQDQANTPACTRLSLLDLWHKDKEASGSLDDGHWMEEIITMIVTAIDTTVSALSLLLVSLATNQQAQEKVYLEIQEVMGSSERVPTTGELNSMTYLGHALTESMRLHGVLPTIAKVAAKDTKLTSITLPAGSTVVISLHAMGWDPQTFPQPDSFCPDRFLQEGSGLSGQFSPFSGGPRSCIGKAYAIFLIKTVMVSLLSKYRLTTTMKLGDIEYEYKTVMFSKTPIMIDFTPR